MYPKFCCVKFRSYKTHVCDFICPKSELCSIMIMSLKQIGDKLRPCPILAQLGQYLSSLDCDLDHQKLLKLQVINKQHHEPSKCEFKYFENHTNKFEPILTPGKFELTWLSFCINSDCQHALSHPLKQGSVCKTTLTWTTVLFAICGVSYLIQE